MVLIVWFNSQARLWSLDYLSHSCISLEAVSMKNFEALLNLKQDLKKKIDNGQTQLAESIQERRKIKDYLTGLLEVFKLYTSEAEILQEENNIRIALLISLLAGITSKTRAYQISWNYSAKLAVKNR